MPCGRFVFLGASRLRVEPPVTYQGIPKNEDVGWLLLAARGWRGFCFLHSYLLKNQIICYAYKNHDSPEAGGDQQASLTWAATGLIALWNAVEQCKKNSGCCHEQKTGESNRHDRLVPKGNPQGGTAYFIP
jgi:hypothetical protein